MSFHFGVLGSKVKFQPLALLTLILILVIIIVPTSQSEVTDTQSHDNQPRQDDERSQVEINNGMCVHKCCY